MAKYVDKDIDFDKWKEVLNRPSVQEELKKAKTPVEIVKNAGNLYITSVIQEINTTGNYDILNSEKYSDFVETYSKYRGNKEVDDISSNYLMLTYALTTLYNTHNIALNDFDRQSLKLNTILTEMYLIEKDISNIKFYQYQKKNNIQRFLDLEEKANQVADDFIKTMEKQRGKMTEEQYKAFDTFIEMNTASKRILLEEREMLKKGDKEIAEYMAKEKHISKYANAEENTGLVRVIYRSLAIDISTELFLNAIYEVLDIDATLYIKSVFELLSYKIVCEQIDSLLSLADDNNSIDEEFKKSEAFKLFVSYIDLKDTIKKKTTQKVLKEETEKVKTLLQKELNKPRREREADIDSLVENILITCRQNIYKELRW